MTDHTLGKQVEPKGFAELRRRSLASGRLLSVTLETSAVFLQGPD